MAWFSTADCLLNGISCSPPRPTPFVERVGHLLTFATRIYHSEGFVPQISPYVLLVKPTMVTVYFEVMGDHRFSARIFPGLLQAPLTNAILDAPTT